VDSEEETEVSVKMKPEKTRLTKPQERLLREIAGHPGRTGWSEFPPLMKLADIGFVQIKQGKFSCTSFLTDAGREWLEANTE
jgi:hypothetical protein